MGGYSRDPVRFVGEAESPPTHFILAAPAAVFAWEEPQRAGRENWSKLGLRQPWEVLRDNVWLGIEALGSNAVRRTM